ncbi:MAG: carbamoyltransferase HypF [Urechidicola sp.]|nr:carbamoyltransferase HypF [Urechidicola sp.]
MKGIIQGVGFRPFIYKLASELKLKGRVNNTANGVHIEFNSDKNLASLFVKRIEEEAPKLSVITQLDIVEVRYKNYSEFKIIHSSSNEDASLLLTPDFAMCLDCKEELAKEKNKRYHYPFITCTNCGPRYSIIKTLPYDRETTTMEPFKMCPSCKKEYDNPLDRRYYSQTNSCPNCAIELALFEKEKLTENFNNLDYIVEQWGKGKIIAIKGIGGYLLTCDATNPKVIKRLRKLKNRPTKPFALLYHNINELSEDVEMDVREKLELENSKAPIVLLNISQDIITPLAIDEITPNLNQIGVMMPYTPLYKLLLSKFKKPIIATSGNASNSTIIYEDKKAIDELSKIADIILLNNREIVIPQDDSVVKFSSIKSQKIIIRRSRGLAPSYINPKLKLSKKTILSTGAMLKSTFTLLNKENIYISQYLGNTDNYETELNYKNTLSHFKHLFKPKLEVVLVDKHPNYFASIYGKEIAENNNIPVIEIQHHKAHFYAVMGENNLLSSSEKVLGVIWDGTGLGDDGNIWGGEFFVYHNNKVDRVHHLDEFDFILGDKMPKEPRISALAIASSISEINFIKNKFSETEWKIYQKLLQNTTSLKSSSIGRFFDAVASIVLGIDKQSYEGEAAMQLENSAYRYFKTNNVTTIHSYIEDEILPSNFTTFIIKNIIQDIEKGNKKDFIAAKFHITLAHYISIIAKKQDVKKVAFSGGVFQNQWLVELVLLFMNDDFDLYFHKELSPNDECVSFGQLMYYLYNEE